MVKRYAAVPMVRPSIGSGEVSSYWWSGCAEPRSAVAIVTASGADGLRLALGAVEADGEVIVPAFTCDRVVAAVHAIGAVPRYVDVDPVSGAFDMQQLAAAFSESPRAVIVTHMFGVAPDLEHVLALAASKGVAVIEDSALIIDARSTRNTGADLAVYSFGRGKPLPLGGGGVVAARTSEFAAQLRRAAHGDNNARRFGRARMLIGRLRDSDIALSLAVAWSRISPVSGGHATTPVGQLHCHVPTPAVARQLESQLATHVPATLANVTKAALRCYINAFSVEQTAVAGRPGARIPEGVATTALVMRSSVRDRLVVELGKAGIDCPHYWPYSVALRSGNRDCPGAATLAGELLYLPLHDGIDDHAARRIAQVLRGHSLIAFN